MEQDEDVGGQGRDIRHGLNLLKVVPCSMLAKLGLGFLKAISLFQRLEDPLIVADYYF